MELHFCTWLFLIRSLQAGTFQAVDHKISFHYAYFVSLYENMSSCTYICVITLYYGTVQDIVCIYVYMYEHTHTHTRILYANKMYYTREFFFFFFFASQRWLFTPFRGGKGLCQAVRQRRIPGSGTCRRTIIILDGEGWLKRKSEENAKEKKTRQVHLIHLKLF